MNNLSREAQLIEGIVRRVLQRYKETLLFDCHRRAIDVLLDNLSGIVRDVCDEMPRTHPDALPGPYDLGAIGRMRKNRKRQSRP